MRKREVPVKNSAVTSKKNGNVLSSAKMRSAPGAPSSANTSSGPAQKTIDLEVEVDIIYSQYLHAKMMQKLMAEKRAKVENALKEQFSSLLQKDSGLENPNVSNINKCTEQLKQLKMEHIRLLELKEEIQALDSQSLPSNST